MKKNLEKLKLLTRNKQRELRLSELPLELQEHMEGYIAQFIPRNRVVYRFFDVYDLEEERS